MSKAERLTEGRYRIGVDVGGTFTDFALFDDEAGEIQTHKRLTTPASPAAAVLDGSVAIARQAGLELKDITTIVHGTTLVTNAIIERKGVNTAMLVSEGFRDTLDIGHERRYDLFDLRLQFPSPIVPRNLRFEVGGRLRADGSEEAPLRLDGELEAAVLRAITEHDISAVAICFLHSYHDDRHEAAAAAWLKTRFPNLAIASSAAVFPFMREYERWTTACLNAYVQPVVDRYIGRIEAGLAELGFRGRFFVMSSSGGTLTADVARRFPVRLLESGPAAGALMSARHGHALGQPQLLSFDMGGTTAKGCIIQHGAPLKRYDFEVARVHEFKKGSGLPIKIPVIDMIEIGAGGGSLAEIDERGTLRVGPRSAGAAPGPACYAQGGSKPTLTDANLLLGYLSPNSFLGGRMKLDPGAARDAITKTVAEPLGLSVERAAWGIHEVINEDVARAFRIHASERGVDYRSCNVVVFGGSGPVHGCNVARKLKIPRVICPSGAGVMSAFGLLSSPIGFELVKSRRTPLAGLDQGAFTDIMTTLAGEAERFLVEAGVPPQDITLSCKLDMRYVGQGYEIEIPAAGGAAALPHLAASFNERYRAIFGLRFDERALEIVNWKVEAVGPTPGQDAIYSLRRDDRDNSADRGEREAFFAEAGGFVSCRVLNRHALPVGARIVGPALVEENESTCVIGPADSGFIDQAGNLVIDIGAAA